MPAHEKIDYLELPARDLNQVKTFFEQAFAWQFNDHGDDYTAFSNQGLDGGFYRCDKHSSTDLGAALIVFYSSDLVATERKIVAANGTISKPTFAFPGGRRFHFCDPNGNEYAVWTDAGEQTRWIG